MPPASTVSYSPSRISASARAMARMPEAHTLLTVSEPTSSRSPAPSETCRDGMWPCPAWMTVPIHAVADLVRRRRPRGRSRHGRRQRRVRRRRAVARPPRRRPKGVRAAPRMTVRFTAPTLPCDSCPSARPRPGPASSRSPSTWRWWAGPRSSRDSWARRWFALGVAIVGLPVASAIFLALAGTTPGKRATGLRVVGADGRRPPCARSCVASCGAGCSSSTA